MTAMPISEPPPSQDQEREAKRRKIKAAREAIDRDGVISHARMVAWLDSWDTADELPPPSAEPWK
jgi:hypothetical protein